MIAPRFRGRKIVKIRCRAAQAIPMETLECARTSQHLVTDRRDAERHAEAGLSTVVTCGR
jgi:hypothetical protein